MTQSSVKSKLYEIIFGTDTPAGKNFDLVLIFTIIVSVLVLMVESMQAISEPYTSYLRGVEWFFTIVFTIEYGVRIYCSPNRWRYLVSFYGIIDLLSVLPTYLGLFFTDANYLLVVRLMRVMRVFRVLKLFRYLNEANVLMRAIMMTRRKITVFFLFVLVLSTVFGSLMYVVEGAANGFTSIPKSIYWTIVTITTVGYGDITPTTTLGQIIASMAMLTGYSIIAVPTGILTAELSNEMKKDREVRKCPACSKGGHEIESKFCRFCGNALDKR